MTGAMTEQIEKKLDGLYRKVESGDLKIGKYAQEDLKVVFKRMAEGKTWQQHVYDGAGTLEERLTKHLDGLYASRGFSKQLEANAMTQSIKVWGILNQLMNLGKVELEQKPLQPGAPGSPGALVQVTFTVEHEGVSLKFSANGATTEDSLSVIKGNFEKVREAAEKVLRAFPPVDWTQELIQKESECRALSGELDFEATERDSG